MISFTPTKRIKSFLVGFLTLSLVITIQAESLVNFQKISLEEATTLEKKILVSFTAEWCLPCKMMDETIFADQEISELINENFIAVKADIDSEKGNHWNDLYNANYLPTTLFAKPSGVEIERLNGNTTKEEFLALLHRILAVEEKIEIPATPVSSIEPEIKKETLLVSNFMLQIGAFGSEDNAQKLISQLEDKDHFNHSVIQEYSSSGRLLYKVVLTGFYTEPEAIESLTLVQRQGFPGFIKKL